ncbi:MAG: NADH-quinone oxidoreductase subunit H, partial [Chloroflexota bacterium]|nr:NADH-quinone oxidoreductase subunit H [Chloroflexota bacterium]
MGDRPMTALGFVVLLLFGAYLVAVLEAWIATGRLRLAGPLLSGFALLGQESLVPRRPDRLLFEIAPPVLLLAAIGAAAVLPLAPDVILIDLATGALFVNAAWAYVMVALLMAGWGPNGAYAMVAGWRFLGQLVAYSMLIVMPITAVAMRAESLSTTAIVRSQETSWNLLSQPLGFVLFWIAAMAACFLPPFDHPLAPGELAGGVTAEYTGVRLAVFRLGWLVLVVTLAIAIVVFFLGGWLGPWLPGWVWTPAKTLAVVAIMLAGGRVVPRLRAEHLLAWSWKVGIPLA